MRIDDFSTLEPQVLQTELPSLQLFLETLLHQYDSLDQGKVADYIPELAKVDPDLFAISVITVDGQVFEVGDHHHPFTLQSISKVW